MPRTALITGITGQDGSYLAELLLEKGYEVHGIIRRSSSFNTGRIDHIFQDPHKRGARLFLHYGDLSDSSGINRLLRKVRPAEIYHLGAQSHVRVSFETPEYTGDVTALSTVRVLEAVLESGIKTKFYQASSSEMYGSVSKPAREDTPFSPRSPYAISKVFAYWTTVNYREAYRIFACNGILFNHESPRRGETFVTRKITRALARIVAGRQDHLYLGNLDARRDWGFAGDYVRAMWLMLQAKKPGDYVVATGEAHSVREFLDAAFGCVGRDWRPRVKFDARYLRPTEVDRLVGDASKARRALGWRPTVDFRGLVEMMVREDLRLEGLDPARHMRPAS